ncbi:MAG: DUF2783 domain-containing protein [Caldimonas sp.]
MKTAANIPDPDRFYEAWVAAHEGLSEAESHDLDARLLLLLANQIGDQAVLLACIAEARRRDGPDDPGGASPSAADGASPA